MTPATPASPPSPVTCYEGRTTVPRPDDPSRRQEIVIVMKRSIAPSEREIDEQLTEFSNAQLEIDLVEHVDGNAFTLDERHGLYRGSGTFEAGAPWQWTAWSWTVDGGDLNIESHYRVTPSGLSIRRITPEFEARAELWAFDCADYPRRIAAGHARLFGK